MSCENNGNSVSRAAGRTAGLPTVVSKSGFVFGRMAYNLNPVRRFGIMAANSVNTAVTVSKVAREINPVTVVGKSLYRRVANLARTISYANEVMQELKIGESASKATTAAINTTENLAGTGTAFAGYAMGVAGPEETSKRPSLSRDLARLRDIASSGPGQFIISKLVPQLGLSLMIGKVAQGVLSVGVSRLVRLSKTRDLGTTTQEKRLLFFFKQKVAINMWGSSLTPSLNRMDLVGNPQKIVSSNGAMFKPGRFGTTWHNGTTRVKLSNGQTRIISHLQDLTYPASHYYFNRQLSNKEAVGIASGQIKPETVPGYVGYVSPLEGLMPTWSNAKQALIKSYLSYGPTGKKA